MNLEKIDIKLSKGTDGWAAFGKFEGEEKWEFSGLGETSEEALICLNVCIKSQIAARTKWVNSSEKIIMEDSQ